MLLSNQESLRGRIAVVTGASRGKGIGAAICRALAEAGADVFFTYWSPYDATMPWGDEADFPHQLAEELRSLGVRCEGMALDLSAPDAPEALLRQVEETLGSPMILVNNATHSTNNSYKNLDAAALDAHYAVNLRAMALLSTQFARGFQKSEGGRIINLSSGQSLGPMPDELAYVATKGAIEAFTRTLAVEVAPLGITVNAVNPGPTDTGWMTDDLRNKLLPQFPFGRIGEPEDIARLVAFLATDEACWITGQVIHSEGGFIRR